MAHELNRDQLQAIGRYFKNPVKDSYKWGQFGFKVVLEDDKEYVVFEDHYQAEYQVKDNYWDILNSGDLDFFGEDAVESYVSVKKSKLEDFAETEASDYVNNMDDDEIFENSGVMSPEDIRREIAEVKQQLSESEDPKTEKEWYSKLLRLKRQLESGGDLEKAKELLNQQHYEFVLEQMQDPLQYFVKEGNYTFKDFIKQPWVSVDWDGFLDSYIDMSSVAGELAIVDNREHEIPTGTSKGPMYAYRTD